MAIINPVDIYRRAVFHPNNPNNNTSATSLIIGAAIRNENVTPRGMPDSTNPRKSGMAEQEQNGVTTPNKLASTLPAHRKLLIFTILRQQLILHFHKLVKLSG
jgi:hypothetical protein